MAIWEIDVELRVRLTLRFSEQLDGQFDSTRARKVTAAYLCAERLLQDASSRLSSCLKWTDGETTHRPMPVITIIDNDPQIVAVRRVER